MFTSEVMASGFELLFNAQVLIVIICSGLYGLFIGSMPGLTATMAVALLVPITFYMPPVPAVASIITMSAMAIFSGDIPGTLLHIPGTPSSAAYCDDSYALAKKGKAATVLGVDLVMSCIGGLVGSLILLTMAPMLAEVALQFSSYEFFFLACIGLSCAVLISAGSPLKGLISLLIGLLINCIGLDITLGFPRFTFDRPELFEGFSFIPAMIGMFGIAEIFKNVAQKESAAEKFAMVTTNIFKGTLTLIKQKWGQLMRSSLLGTGIGILPGAGGDIAAWICYGISKKFSKNPDEYGKGSLEGIANSTSANNAAISGFILANLLMIPLGWLLIRLATKILYVPQHILYPIIVGFCIVGAFAINNTHFDVLAMLGFGVLAFVMILHEIPVAPCILGLVLGDMLENTFMQSMIKSDWDLTSFFERPISATLGVITIALWLSPLVMKLVKPYFKKNKA